ncbi:hypothetical protein Dsin_006861 [Dipteronia sinensis]|uniref:Uncharacterized protein n=1 Tax=Dipteronia sinensis TaxID=43782 RepID=A0AAE0B0R5_9ROSI|nr:hypothetical protein Dsin_006861 [Dipteronia sinensis]
MTINFGMLPSLISKFSTDFFQCSRFFKIMKIFCGKNQCYLQDKGKLKSAFARLVRCLSLLPCNKRNIETCEKTFTGQGILHAFEPDVPTESAGMGEHLYLSIDHAVGFFVYGIRQGKPSLHGGPDGAIWDQTVSSVLMKRFFNVFPLKATHNLSAKV